MLDNASDDPDLGQRMPVPGGYLSPGSVRWQGGFSMADAERSPAEAEGLVFGYLGVKISGSHVWTTGRGT